MAKVTLENIVKRFGRVIAVNNVNLEVRDREFVVLLGPSGCGKTTTLRIIAGLEFPDEGRVYIDDRDVTDLEPKERDVAMVFQNYALYPHLSVFDNIAFPLMIKRRKLGLTREEIRKRVIEVAKMMKIDNLLDRKPGQLSGGQQQRVALARTLIRRPKVWLMDEPLSNLDALLRLEMRAELKRLQRELGITTVYVTHDQAEAMSMADRIAVMNNGRIIQLGTPDEIYLKPSHVFVGTFIGSPPMNIVRCTTMPREDGVYIECPGFTRKLPGEAARALEDKTVLIGIRPEFIEVYREPRPDAIKAKILVVEPQGSEVILNVDINPGVEETILKVKTKIATRFRPGEIIYLVPDWSKASIFSESTGKALI